MRERMEDNREAAPLFDQREYRSQLETLEHDFLFGPSLPQREVAKRTGALRNPAMPRQEMLDFFEAVSAHETANQYRAAFLAYLGKDSRARNTSPVQLTREDVTGLFERWPERPRIEEEEERAITHYEEAVESTWRGKHLDSLDAQMLLMDLKARRAARFKDPAAREGALRMCEKELHALIPGVRPLGKQNEYRLLWLLRRWAREAGQDHVLSIEHALPKDDLAHGIDLVVMANDQIANVQLKTPPEGGAASSHHQENIAKTKEMLIGKPVDTVVIGYEAIREAFELQTMDPGENIPARLSQLRAEILTALEKQLKGKREVLFEMLQALKPREKTKRISRQQLERNTSVATLRAFGLLTPREERDLAAVLEIKKRFFQATRGLIQTPGDLQNPAPELVKKVQAAAGQLPEA